MSLLSIIAHALAGVPMGYNLDRVALRRGTDYTQRSRSKYTPHEGKRQQERHRLQRQTAVVMEPANTFTGFRPRVMNAWLARNRKWWAVADAAEGGAR
jgi:hypothetical protein